MKKIITYTNESSKFNELMTISGNKNTFKWLSKDTSNVGVAFTAHSLSIAVQKREWNHFCRFLQMH